MTGYNLQNLSLVYSLFEWRTEMETIKSMKHQFTPTYRQYTVCSVITLCSAMRVCFWSTQPHSSFRSPVRSHWSTSRTPGSTLRSWRGRATTRGARQSLEDRRVCLFPSRFGAPVENILCGSNCWDYYGWQICLLIQLSRENFWMSDWKLLFFLKIFI